MLPTVIDAYIAAVRNEHMKSCGLGPLKRNILHCPVLHFDAPIEHFSLYIYLVVCPSYFSLLPSYSNSKRICKVIKVLIITYCCPMLGMRNQCLSTKPFTTHSLRLLTRKKFSFLVAQLSKFFPL